MKTVILTQERKTFWASKIARGSNIRKGRKKLSESVNTFVCSPQPCHVLLLDNAIFRKKDKLNFTLKVTADESRANKGF